MDDCDKTAAPAYSHPLRDTKRRTPRGWINLPPVLLTERTSSSWILVTLLCTVLKPLCREQVEDPSDEYLLQLQTNVQRRRSQQAWTMKSSSPSVQLSPAGQRKRPGSAAPVRARMDASVGQQSGWRPRRTEVKHIPDTESQHWRLLGQRQTAHRCERRNRLSLKITFIAWTSMRLNGAKAQSVGSVFSSTNYAKNVPGRLLTCSRYLQSNSHMPVTQSLSNTFQLEESEQENEFSSVTLQLSSLNVKSKWKFSIYL